jgi:hypothetical protein
MVGVDFRGKQSSIFRLRFFDNFALIHMIFYRIIVVLGVVTGLSIFGYVIFGVNELLLISEYLILCIGILFTPQLYEVIQVLNLKITNAHISKYMNNSFLVSNNLKKRYIFLNTINVLAVVVWIALLIIYFKMLIL